MSSVDAWSPAHHLVRFVMEVIQRLGLSTVVSAYRGSGGVSPEYASGFSGPWLCHGRILKPQTEVRDLRFGRGCESILPSVEGERMAGFFDESGW